MKYITAKEGYKFTLTAVGAEVPKVRAKFDSNYAYKTQYEKAVPSNWVTCGYVEEVVDGKK